MEHYIIQTKGLSFSYSKNSKKILDTVSLQVPKGSIYGFLGANGAGKSTTMQLLTGSIPDQNGSISIFNAPLEAQLPILFKRIGCLIESPSLYSHLSGLDNLRYIAKTKGLPKEDITAVLQLIGLSRAARQKVREYSMGMKQRLAIGIALLGNPELLFLDEPINSLDPQGVIDIRELLIKLNRERGCTIFISSHLLDEVEKICTHIGVLHNGKLLFDGTLDALKKKADYGQKIEITFKEAPQWFNTLKETYSTVRLEENTIYLEAEHQDTIQKLLLTLLEGGVHITELKTNKNLEHLFLNLTEQKNETIYSIL